MWKNHYFLDEVLDTDRLKELLGHLPADAMPTTWYRARILEGDNPYPIDKLGTPPARLASLHNPRGLVSPFLMADASAIGQLRADIAFLERLGDELTRLVLPREAAIDYIPSQYLCEFIKKAGYDGVVYRSSANEGINLALFDPVNAAGGAVSLYYQGNC